MKAFFFSFLALGITGVFAAPAPENELDARAPCALLCKVGYTAVYSVVSRRCKCVLNDEQVCLRETICIGTHHPVWDPKTTSCSCQPYDFVAEEKCLSETVCIATHKPHWDPTQKKCSCKLIVIEDPNKESCLLATSCLVGTHAFWNPKTKKCSCNPNDGEFICKAATTCSPGLTPIWHPETESCICEKVTKREAAEDFPDPKTCPTIRCGEGTTPKYVPKLGRCICETNPVDLKICPTIRCAEGYTPKYIPGKAHCICEKVPVPTPVDPKTCPTIKCSAGYKPQYNPSTKTCSCVPDPKQCTGWMCIAEQRPVYDPKTKRCGCVWIPGLEPSPISTTTPIITSTPISPCADILCIAEKTPKVNDKGICVCEWIPGLEPGVPTTAATVYKREAKTEAAPVLPSAINPRCKGYCISEKHLVWDPITKKCQCVWIKGFEPGGPYAGSKVKREAEAQIPKPTIKPSPYDPLNCRWLKVYCEGGDHHMVYDPKTKSCKCPKVVVSGTRPTILDPTLVVARTVATNVKPTPAPYDPLNCRWLKVYCEGGDHHMVYDIWTKKCRCPLLIAGSA